MGSCPLATLKKASCLASTAAILAMPETRFESRLATDSASQRMTLSPTKLRDLPSDRNSVVLLEGNLYWHSGMIAAPAANRMF